MFYQQKKNTGIRCANWSLFGKHHPNSWLPNEKLITECYLMYKTVKAIRTHLEYNSYNLLLLLLWSMKLHAPHKCKIESYMALVWSHQKLFLLLLDCSLRYESWHLTSINHQKDWDNSLGVWGKGQKGIWSMERTFTDPWNMIGPVLWCKCEMFPW